MKKEKQIVIRINESMYNRLVKESDKDLRTISGYIRMVLSNHLKGGK